jgi:hypothetical protein
MICDVCGGGGVNKACPQGTMVKYFWIVLTAFSAALAGFLYILILF